MSLYKVFYRQRQKNEFCDVTLEVDGSQFPANRNVLSACSEYFKTMFTNNTKKKIKIKATSSVTMNQVLDFVYSSQIALNDDNVLQLLDAFSLMQIEDAFDQVVKYMNTNLSVENCLFYRDLCRKHSLDNLLKDVDIFILDKFESIVVQDAFNELKYSDIEDLLQSNDLNVQQEETVFEVLAKWIDHDQKSRKQHFPWLFKHVRLQLISQQYLKNTLRKHNLVRDFNDCRDLVEDALLSFMNPTDSHVTQTRRKQVEKKSNAIMLLTPRQSNQTIYNISSKKWIKVSKLNNEIAVKTGSAVAANEHTVFVCGGLNPNNTASSDCYQINEDEWEKLPPMSNARFGAAAVFVQANWQTVYNGEYPVLCVFGGEGSPSSVHSNEPPAVPHRQRRNHVQETHPSSQHHKHVREFITNAEVYGSVKGEWKVFEKNPSNLRSFAAAEFVRGRIYVMGGYSQTKMEHDQFSQNVVASNTIDVFDLESNEWLEGPKMNEPRSSFGSAVIDSKIYVVGGLTTTNNILEYLDTKTDVWTLLTFSLPYNIIEASACAVQDQVYVVGKNNPSFLLRYDPLTKKWIIEDQQVPSLGMIAPYFVE